MEAIILPAILTPREDGEVIEHGGGGGDVDGDMRRRPHLDLDAQDSESRGCTLHGWGARLAVGTKAFPVRRMQDSERAQPPVTEARSAALPAPPDAKAVGQAWLARLTERGALLGYGLSDRGPDNPVAQIDTGLTEEERVRLTARRVGLDVPITHDPSSESSEASSNYRESAKIAQDQYKQDKDSREDQLYSGKGDGLNVGGPLRPPVNKD